MRWKRISRTWCVAAAILVLGGSLIVTSGKASAPAQSARNVEERRLIIRAGTLFTKDGVPISLSAFDATIQSDKPQQQGDDAKQIKDVLVRSGSAFVRASDLGKLLATHVPKDKITDLSVATDGDQLKIFGKMKKTLPVHFEIKGPVNLTPDGMLVLHESTMKVDKMPMKGLADMLGMNPAGIAGNGSSKGIQGKKDELIFDPNLLWGMSVHGKLSAVKVTKNGLMLSYGSSQKPVQRASR